MFSWASAILLELSIPENTIFHQGSDFQSIVIKLNFLADELAELFGTDAAPAAFPFADYKRLINLICKKNYGGDYDYIRSKMR
jgi:hypothetical protein